MVKFIISFVIVLFLIGCATTQVKQAPPQELQNRTAVLETELLAKEGQIRSLEEELYRKEDEAKKDRREKIVSVTPKRIQTALKNTGFYKGPVDNQIGPQTRQAINNFQKAHGLKADGVVGKKTWEKLSKYLN